ncbi:DNA glycosylase AlkZ-like family protein [Pseudonocardia broussonetiae]|uniref:Winged helix DNA-binding domain-containing protein n=1 Tax=Pseudonocardia broussonetiae TaxID=2736640 RepID=A0A6M6JQJ8_9PSEU|nr:crosslink repair DNA glycosylase YcaQ family protein [Pseudonocardia broussonetiae]QJY48689.1 winged helix DNA-binding domain-containing protein [Pseudonocardia broussonetiae]
MELTREQVLAHRLHRHDLVERAASPDAVALLDLGVQDTPPGSLAAALAARTAEPAPATDDPADDDATGDGVLTRVWSHRGAPHLHRTADLPALAAACWPRDDADAAARLGWQRARLAEAGGAARAAFRTLADAVPRVLHGPMTKGELSAALTAVLPAELSPYCAGCGVHHVGEQLLRVAGLAGGIRLRGHRPLLLEPIPGWPGPPADADAGTAALQRGYLRFFPPASAADLAAFLGTTRTALRPDAPPDLVPVTVDGRAAAVAPDVLEQIRAAEPAPVVRLLPPSDPWLQGRDREVVVPDPALRKRVWTALGGPGVVLSGVDVVGLWRAKQRGKRLEVAVEGAAPEGVEEEARRLAVVRGAADVAVSRV